MLHSQWRMEKPATSPSVPETLRHEEPLSAVTNKFCYDDASIRLRVGEQVFQVSRSRLTQRSPVFRALFSLPQPSTDAHANAEVVLHNDPDDFMHFLWFVHADAVDIAELDIVKPETHLDKYLGIATVAHMYEAAAIETWAFRRIEKAFSEGMLCGLFVPHIIREMLQLAAQMDSGSPEGNFLRGAVRRVIYIRAHSSGYIVDATLPVHKADINVVRKARMRRLVPDLAAIVELLDDDNARQLLAHVYYYLLVYRSDRWPQDHTLRPVDRQRLLCGYHTMREKGILTGDPEHDKERIDAIRCEDRCIEENGSELWSFFDLASWRLPAA